MLKGCFLFSKLLHLFLEAEKRTKYLPLPRCIPQTWHWQPAEQNVAKQATELDWDHIFYTFPDIWSTLPRASSEVLQTWGRPYSNLLPPVCSSLHIYPLFSAVDPAAGSVHRLELGSGILEISLRRREFGRLLRLEWMAQSAGLAEGRWGDTFFVSSEVMLSSERKAKWLWR